ncbi:MAG: beta-propeller fold lactonase family protein [Polyangiaceae bacterium]
MSSPRSRRLPFVLATAFVAPSLLAACSLAIDFDESKIPNGTYGDASLDALGDVARDALPEAARTDAAADASSTDAATDGGSRDAGVDGTVNDGGSDAAIDGTVNDGGTTQDGSASQDGSTSQDGSSGSTDSGSDGSVVDRITGFAYAPTAFSPAVIAQWAVHSTGQLTPLTPATITPGESNPTSLAATPDAKFLYVTDGVAGKISQYAIATDGTLSPLTPPSVGGLVGDAGLTPFPAGIAIHPSGRFAYVTRNNSNTVATYSIGTTGTGGEGTLTFVRETPTGGGPTGVAVTPDGSLLLVVDSTSDAVSVFTIDAVGALAPSPTPTVTTASLPNRITVSANGKNAYLTHGDFLEFKNSQFAFTAKPGVAVDPDGGTLPSDGGNLPDGSVYVPPHTALEPLTPPAVAADDTGTLLVANPANSLVFGVNTTASTVSQYSVASNGALSPLTPASVAITVDGGASTLGDMALDPTGSFLYVANVTGNVVHQFAVAPSGITPLTPSSVTAYPGNGRFLVVAKP